MKSGQLPVALIVLAVVLIGAILVGVLALDRDEPTPLRPDAEDGAATDTSEAPPDAPTVPGISERSDPARDPGNPRVSVDPAAAMRDARVWLRRLKAAAPGNAENAVVKELFDALKSSDEQLRLAAVMTLSFARDPQGARFGPRRGGGEREPSPGLDPRTVRAAVMPLFESRSALVRQIAVRTFRTWGAGPEELPVLYRLFDHEDAGVVEEAVAGVVTIHDDRPIGSSVDHLAALLERGKPASVRACLGYLCGRDLDDLLVDRVIEVSRREETDAATRRAAVQCLGSLRHKNRKTVAELIRSWRTDSEDDMHRAISGLHENIPQELRPWITSETKSAVKSDVIPARDGAILIGVHGTKEDISWLEGLLPAERPDEDMATSLLRADVQAAIKTIRSREPRWRET